MPDALRLAGPPPVAVDAPVPCVLYPGAEDGPVYLNFHGGAFIVRHPEQDDHACRYLTEHAGASVLNVDYSTAPQSRFPVAEREAYEVYRWALRHHDPARIVVGGFSAGGKLAIAVCQRARDEGAPMPAALVAAYPLVDLDLDLDKGSGRVAPWLLRAMVGSYFAGVAVDDVAVSPVRDDRLGGFPPSLVLTGERDVLGPSGEVFARRLSEAGVAVEHHCFPGTDHAFTHAEPVETALAALGMMASFVRSRGARASSGRLLGPGASSGRLLGPGASPVGQSQARTPANTSPS
ncbi:alpha/beta hydrolase [Paractinoplanes deccanensis]|uniref:alpha/beta hydrolase n=1 Tax=Paractinoplanes deccanensis TaxID=113561 RepID=UPI0031DB6B69